MATKIFLNVGCVASLALRHRNPFVNNIPQTMCASLRQYAKKSDRKRSDCRLAKSDLPPKLELDCPYPCEPRKKKRLGILHWLKLKVVEGGTNFGTPFRRLDCKPPCEDDEPKKEEKEVDVPKALPAPKKAVVELPELGRGVNVTILGADSPVGHYTALLLKQCPCIKRIRLYEAKDKPAEPERDICKVVHDLQHIDTNCTIQAYGGSPSELSLCLQNSHIVLMLESEAQNLDLSLETRFYSQAPLVRKYVDAISQECPQAFIVICIAPIDCMVPLAAEILKDTGFYDPRKLLGTMAVAEMRASTLAARALSLEPRYTRVPCVGGTEGETLVPLFSKAVEFFDFARHNAELMTETVRYAPKAVAYNRSADLSEAHAHAGMVKAIAYALLCQDIPRVTGFVESDSSQIVSPAKYIANEVEINVRGICTNLGVAPLSEFEMFLMHLAITELGRRQKLAEDWRKKCVMDIIKQYERNYWFLAVDLLLSKHGICKKCDFPPNLSQHELDEIDMAFLHLQKRVNLAWDWYCTDNFRGRVIPMARNNFHIPKHYDHLDECQAHLV